MRFAIWARFIFKLCFSAQITNHKPDPNLGNDQELNVGLTAFIQKWLPEKNRL